MLSSFVAYVPHVETLPHCLAVENDPLLTQALAQVRNVKVVFINGHDSGMAREQKKVGADDIVSADHGFA